jgi:hypothetical protein
MPTESKRPKSPSKAPVRRNTIEVDTSWLIRGEPPPLPSAGPKRRETIEVEADWLLGSSDAEPPAPVVPKGIAAKPRGKLPPPLPREEPADSPPSERKKGSRESARPSRRRPR